ncbi:MAG: DUF47 family protein [Ignavibacteria bacterium]|jgi:hypothetical protein|nr:DUF47 family protein [Ignavibacteria bacterium]
MFRKFLPKNDKFFELLNQLAGNIEEGVKLFHKVIGDFDLLAEYASKIHIIENKCDDLTHTIINELNEAFVTPFDREDIHHLTNVLDDVIDIIDTIVTRLGIYKLKGNIPFGTQLSGIIVSQTELIVQLVEHLNDNKNTIQKIISIRNLETEGDLVFKDALTQLFEKQTDVKELIKEKEILENLEKAVDRCQRVATVMEGIIIKNA